MKAMRTTWWRGLLPSAAALGIAMVGSVPTHGQNEEAWHGVLDEHPAIQYATRPTSDRVREALFAMLDDVGGTSVLDLFARLARERSPFGGDHAACGVARELLPAFDQ